MVVEKVGSVGHGELENPVHISAGRVRIQPRRLRLRLTVAPDLSKRFRNRVLMSAFIFSSVFSVA